MYLQSPISWSSFKPLAIYDKTFWRYLADKVPFWVFQRCIIPDKEVTDKTKYGSAIFHLEIYMWIFKIVACTVHKLWYASDFIQILFKGALLQKERELGQENCVKYFPMRNPYIWNFETLACTVLDELTDGRAGAYPKPVSPVNFFAVGGINTSETIVITHSNAK